MRRHKLVPIIGGIVGAITLVLVALYIARPGQRKLTYVQGPTPYPSIELYPTLTPSPAPNRDARIATVADGGVTPVPVSSPFHIDSTLKNGELLLFDADQRIETLNPLTGETRFLTSRNVSGTEPQTSSDRRYVVWIEPGLLSAYDSSTGAIAAGVPRNGLFDNGVPGGGLLVSAEHGSATLVIGADGTITGRISPPAGRSAFSPDGRWVAFPMSDGLHIRDRMTNDVHTLPDVQWYVGELAWSPDSSQFAYGRVSGNDSVHIWIANAMSGTQHEVYAADPGIRIERLQLTRTQVSFHLVESLCCIAPFGVRYTVGVDGGNVRAIDDPAHPWDECGPACGMPPDGYADGGGLARWCEQQPQGDCKVHLVFVDRIRSEVQDLFANKDDVPAAISPDNRTVALLRPDGANQVLRLVRLGNFSYREINLGFSFVTSIAWLPDGEHVLLYNGPGGN